MRSLVVVTIVMASYGLALAQYTEEDPTKADKLFEEGQKLKQQGNTKDACKKYEESLYYNHNAVGTLLNVALCAEEAHKYATALKYFTQARDLAREHNLAEHKKAADEHVAKNQPLVAHLALTIAEPAPDTKLVIDDDSYPLSQAADIGLDPGSHRIVVSAPGRVAYETTVTMEQGQPKAISVPKLGYPVTNTGRRTLGQVLTFSGAGLIVSSMVIALYADHTYYQAIKDGHCTESTPHICDVPGYGDTGTARTLGNVATAVGAVGIIAAGVGAYLWLFAPKDHLESRDVAIVPSVDNQSAGLSAIGRF